jgi:hypothetical protein
VVVLVFDDWELSIASFEVSIDGAAAAAGAAGAAAGGFCSPCLHAARATIVRASAIRFIESPLNCDFASGSSREGRASAAAGLDRRKN